MNQHRPQQVPPKDNTNPFHKPVIRPDEKEDQADSGPDRDNPITQESKQPAADSEQAAQNREKIASVASKMTTVLGIGFAVVWLVFKAAYYVTCAFYLRRREVVQYFEPARTS